MRSERSRLFRHATITALRIRQGAGLGLAHPISIVDFVESQGVEVRFADIPSMEGMYCADPGPLILISSERPSGRQAFTCAHEYGHHVFGHGTKVDKSYNRADGSGLFDPIEYLVDCFAGALLLPRPLVYASFVKRSWDISTATEIQFYVVAGFLGVSYEGLIRHLSSVRVLCHDRAALFLAARPSSIKRDILGLDHSGELFVVDSHWVGRPVDLRVGDLVIVRESINLEGSALVIDVSMSSELGNIYRAIHPGISRLTSKGGTWSVFSRVARRGFAGRSQYRHLDSEVEE